MANSSTTTTSAGAERRKAAKAIPDGEIRLNGAAAAAQAQAEADQKEKDFFWTYTEEPHRTRRLAIIKAHPEVCLLVGPSRIEAVLIDANGYTLSLHRSRSYAVPNH